MLAYILGTVGLLLIVLAVVLWATIPHKVHGQTIHTKPYKQLTYDDIKIRKNHHHGRAGRDSRRANYNGAWRQ